MLDVFVSIEIYLQLSAYRTSAFLIYYFSEKNKDSKNAKTSVQEFYSSKLEKQQQLNEKLCQEYSMRKDNFKKV